MYGAFSFSRVFRYFFSAIREWISAILYFCACIRRSFLFVSLYTLYLCWLIFCYFLFSHFPTFFSSSLPLITEICCVHRSQWRYPCYGSGKLYIHKHICSIQSHFFNEWKLRAYNNQGKRDSHWAMFDIKAHIDMYARACMKWNADAQLFRHVHTHWMWISLWIANATHLEHDKSR